MSQVRTPLGPLKPTSHRIPRKQRAHMAKCP